MADQNPDPELKAIEQVIQALGSLQQDDGSSTAQGAHGPGRLQRGMKICADRDSERVGLRNVIWLKKESFRWHRCESKG
jgi:hypothetical protein